MVTVICIRQTCLSGNASQKLGGQLAVSTGTRTTLPSAVSSQLVLDQIHGEMDRSVLPMFPLVLSPTWNDIPQTRSFSKEEHIHCNVLSRPCYRKKDSRASSQESALLISRIVLLQPCNLAPRKSSGFICLCMPNVSVPKG